MNAEDWAARIAAAEERGVLNHGHLTFLLTDRPAPPGRDGKVWSDTFGHGWWMPDRRGMVMVERRR